MFASKTEEHWFKSCEDPVQRSLSSTTKGDTTLVDEAPEAKYEMIREIEKELENLRIQRPRLQNEWRTWAERRNSLNSELKELSEKIRSIKSERDNMNAEVKAFKTSRDKIREEIADKWSKMSETSKPLKDIRSEVKGTFQDTRKSFEDLEWRLQTSSLDPKEENRLIAQIKELEIRLVKHQELNNLQSEIRGQKTTLDTLKHDAQSIHEKVLVSAESSAKVHERMMQLVKKLKETKAAADEAHKRFLQARAESEQAEQELLKKAIEKKKLQRELFGNEEAERQRKRKEFVDKLAESGSTKLSQGKKVSLEEFKALMEQKKIFPTTEADQSPV